MLDNNDFRLGQIVGDGITTSHPNDTYNTHDAFLGRGGSRSVRTLAVMHAIPDDRRELGMTVTVVEENYTEYQLRGGTTNDHWAIVGAGAGGGTQGIYSFAFTESDWEPYLTYYRLTIPAAVHQRGLEPAVLEVLRGDAGSWVAVSTETRRYPNGDISLFSTYPFGGKVAAS